jgi:hypothetical protein
MPRSNGIPPLFASQKSVAGVETSRDSPLRLLLIEMAPGDTSVVWAW